MLRPPRNLDLGAAGRGQKDLWPYAPAGPGTTMQGIAVTSMGKTTEAC